MSDVTGGKLDQSVRASVLDQLDRVCGSESFRQSRQSVKLLRYLVEHSLDGNEEALRERAIGSTLFGREPKYDTNEDSIVRVSVAEVRKRLARYYHEAGADQRLEVTIPVGSYRVEFHTREAPKEEPEMRVAAPVSETARNRKWRLAVVAAVAAIAAAGVYLAWPKPAVDRFWGPALADKSAVVILAPHPVVYSFTRETFRRFRKDDATHAQRQIEALSGPEDAVIPLKDVVPIRDQYLGLGSAHAISSVAAIMAVREKAYQLKFGRSFSFQDIRHAPAVLVGAYANRWTLQLTEDFRFTLADRGGAPQILDRKTGTVWALKDLQPDGRTSEDYVIVSRIFHPKTGRLVVGLAGITQYGTQAAGEFVTDEEILGEAILKAPRGWEQLNLQYVLYVPVVEGVPGRPTVVATHYW